MIFQGTLRKIKEIVLVKVIEVIKKIEEITKISVIEVIESMPDVTLRGSEGVAFKQTSPSAGSWESPNGHSDPYNKWNDETNAYDDNTGTYAQSDLLGTYQWGWDLIFTFSPAIKANKVRFWIDNEDQRVHIYGTINGAYVSIFWGKLGTGAFVEKTFSQGMVSEIAIRFYNYDTPDLYPRIHEVDVWKVPTTGGVIIIEELGSLTSPPEGKTINKKVYAYNGNDDIDTIKYYQTADLLFTLTYAYDGNKNITSITRS